MGCSKPPVTPCPQSTCIGCSYWYYSGGYTGTSLPQGTAKFITQFTDEELIAELQRRMNR